MTDLQVIEKFTRCPRCRSFSVSHSELEFREQLKAHFIPLHAFYCNNCSSRFIEQGEFSLKYNKNWLLAVLSAALITGSILMFFLFSGDNNDGGGKNGQVIRPPESASEVTTPPVDPNGSLQPKETKPTELGDNNNNAPYPGDTGNTVPPPVNNPEEKKPDPETLPPTPLEPVISGEIILGNSNRFGANWRNVEKGLQISRISNGPLKNAGLEIGDIITDVDGLPVASGDSLLNIRNEISSGRRREVILKVLHQNKIIYYRMVRTANPKLKKNDPKTETDKNKAAGAPTTNITEIPQARGQSVRLFSSNTIKIRKSMPDEENASKRYTFERNKVVVRRTPEQRVFIAGDTAGQKNWAVDNQIVVNRKSFSGLSMSDYPTGTGFIPDNASQPPLDITHIIPADRPVSLQVELVDFGRYFGNTEVYIVVK